MACFFRVFHQGSYNTYSDKPISSIISSRYKIPLNVEKSGTSDSNRPLTTMQVTTQIKKVKVFIGIPKTDKQ
jgi:hypothetical protein